MKTTKISLTNIQGKLSKAEMKNIMAGFAEIGDSGCGTGCSGTCHIQGYDTAGTCGATPAGSCRCTVVY